MESKTRRRQTSPSYELAAFEKQVELAARHPNTITLAAIPQRSKASLLEPFRIDAQTRAVPDQHLGTNAVARHEEEQASAQRIHMELLADQRRQAVEPLSKVGWCGVGEDLDLATATDHPSERRSAVAEDTSSPSTR